MTDEPSERVRHAFGGHDAFDERDATESGGPGFVVTTTRFDAWVVVEDGEHPGNADRSGRRYRVTVEVPTLSAAVEERVADVVEDGWFDTFRLRLEDAAMAVPGTVEIDGPETRIEGERVVVEATFEDDADRAPRTAKALVDYVEGTYAEGVIPGYEYRPPISDLLASARHDDSSTDAGGPMPM